IMGNIASSESPRDLAMKVREVARQESRIVTVGPMQAVSWYTGRRVLVTGNPDELAFGSKQGDQSARIPDREALLRLWSGPEHVLLILKKQEFEALAPLLKPQVITVMESGRRMLISNR
ncbi:MAG: hypothetical protein Q7V04_09350, partial [Deltaproteobacteria bacterium]|nr:hypothetical protein [Deltaproteobacteria bacterium]